MTVDWRLDSLFYSSLTFTCLGLWAASCSGPVFSLCTRRQVELNLVWFNIYSHLVYKAEKSLKNTIWIECSLQSRIKDKLVFNRNIGKTFMKLQGENKTMGIR